MLKNKLIRFLRFTEKYAKTDMVHFAKSNFWLNLNRGLSVVNGLALSVAFAHFLTKESYGTYAFVLAVLGLFSMPTSSALGAGIGKPVSRGHSPVIFEGMRAVLPWSLASGIGLCLVGGYYFFSGNNLLAISFVLGGIILPISVANGVAKSFLNSKGNFQLTAKFSLWRTPLMSVLLILTAYFTESAFYIIVVSILGNALLGLLLYTQVKKIYAAELSQPTEEKFPGKFAFHSAILSVFGYLSEKMDSILLWKFAGAAPVAIYNYALSPVREIRSVIETQGVIAAPKFAQKEFAHVRANISLRVRQMYIIALPLMILYMVAAPYIFKYMFPQYIEAVGLSQLLALSLLSAPRRLLSIAISAHQRIKDSYITSVLPNAIRLILMIILVPLYGIKGAAIALLAAEAVDYVILGILMKRSAKEDLVTNE